MVEIFKIFTEFINSGYIISSDLTLGYFSIEIEKGGRSSVVVASTEEECLRKLKSVELEECSSDIDILDL